ncbi:MAG: RNase adapter RapZ [Candidatus Nanopelagicales bacterium]
MSLDVVIVTGLAGAGRSTAAHALEDLGYFVIDNLPPELMNETVELLSKRAEISKVALVADSRGGALFEALESELEKLRIATQVFVLFLEANDQILIRRFEAARRPHPIQKNDTLAQSVSDERKLLDGLKTKADLVIDTSEKNVHELRKDIEIQFGPQSLNLLVHVISFGYKYGLPLDADFVFDVRCLPNPFWREDLRELTGVDKAVQDFVMSDPLAQNLMNSISSLLENLKPGFLAEGKRFLTLAIGCTGGQHRSVTLAESMRTKFQESDIQIEIHHRDKGRE